MDFAQIRILPLLAAGVVFMFVGGIWYGPLFGKAWMRLSGKTLESVQSMPKSTLTAIYLWSFVAAVATSYVLSLFIEATMRTTFGGGAVIGLLAGVGFCAMAFATNYLFNQRPFPLWLIDSGYQTLTLTLAGALLGGWR
jgi:hypothetical protein